MKKYKQPIKLKRACRTLIEYIDASNGVYDYEEWCEEVEQAKATVNPKDRKAFEEIAEQFRIMGEMITEAYQYIDSQLLEMDRLSNKVLKSIK